MTSERILAVGLLSQADMDRLGKQFSWVWPVTETPCFNSLLDAIEQADREFRREKDDIGDTPVGG